MKTAVSTLGERALLSPLTEPELGALLYILAGEVAARHARSDAHGDIDAVHVLLDADGRPTLRPAAQPGDSGSFGAQAQRDLDALICLGLELGEPGQLRDLLNRRHAGARELREALAGFAGGPLPRPLDAEESFYERDAPTPDSLAAIEPPAGAARPPWRWRYCWLAAIALVALLCLVPRERTQQTPCDPPQVCAPVK